MQLALFTKLFEARTPDEIAPHAVNLGFDGIDLLIRDGYTVAPSLAESDVPAAVARFAEAGVGVPLATTSLTDAGAHDAERIIAACAGAGIGLIRTGYWRYDANEPYAAVLDNARRELAGLAKLAEKHGTRVAVQMHGGTIHNSGASLRALLTDLDPAHVAAYPDPGNQAVQEGREDWRLTLDLVADWLACFGVKNGGWRPVAVDADGQRRWESEWLGIADGMVPWSDILRHLADTDFNGILTLHSHYELPFDDVLEQTLHDRRFVSQMIGASS